MADTTNNAAAQGAADDGARQQEAAPAKAGGRAFASGATIGALAGAGLGLVATIGAIILFHGITIPAFLAIEAVSMVAMAIHEGRGEVKRQNAPKPERKSHNGFINSIIHAEIGRGFNYTEPSVIRPNYLREPYSEYARAHHEHEERHRTFTDRVLESRSENIYDRGDNGSRDR